MKDIILQITAGSGPKECQWVVVKLALAFCKEAKKEGLTGEILWDDKEASAAQSCLVKFTGSGAGKFTRARTGTVRWIGQSPFRKNHKRRNWYVGVMPALQIEDIPELFEKDIRYQTLKASGPGGQHVNKTESAVRATHIPTGMTALSQQERSQFANKRITRIKLAMLLAARRTDALNQNRDAMWSAHKALERGNEIRVYEGPKFSAQT